jgi:hypothetical protein
MRVYETMNQKHLGFYSILWFYFLRQNAILEGVMD